MEQFDRNLVRVLIETSSTFEQADDVIKKITGFTATREKIAFIKGMFDCSKIIGHKDDTDELVYFLLLNSIVQKTFCN